MPVPARIRTRVLITLQTLLVAAYAYGVIAFVSTDATYFPEQSPPAWALPAVLATALGPLVAVLTLPFAALLLRRPSYRAANDDWRLLAVTTAATLATAAVMASPLGWHLFDWYIS